jgi:hypothetical protein
MTNILPISKTNMSKFQNSNLFIILTAFAGMALGAIASLAIAGSLARPTVGVVKTVAMRPASVMTDCSVPTATVGAARTGGSVLSAAVVAPVEGGKGGDGPNAPTKFVHRLVTGLVATTTATISDTGPNSTNEITTINKNTTTITNHNSVSVTNNSDQDADSGDANVSGNTNAGSAQTGTAQNTNETSTKVEITN